MTQPTPVPAPAPAAPPSYKAPPPPTEFCQISVPAPHVFLVTLNRPKALNAINSAGHAELSALWQWMDAEPSLRVGIITGEGRAFCAGADLKEWNAGPMPVLDANGFGGLSTRSGRKPVIAAVNGICVGGGCEMILNCDMVIATRSAAFALPEAKRGVVALAGSLSWLVRIVGRQRASEMALLGRMVSAEEAREWGFVNRVVEEGEVVAEAVRMGVEVAGNSPDSVIVTRVGINLAWEGVEAQEATVRLRDQWWARMEDGENLKEGIRAFVEKRAPVLGG